MSIEAIIGIFHGTHLPPGFNTLYASASASSTRTTFLLSVCINPTSASYLVFKDLIWYDLYFHLIPKATV